MMEKFCPFCEEITKQQFIKEEKQVDVRGEIIIGLFEYFLCKKCGEKYEKPRKDYDPFEPIYREFRERKGLLQPEMIREIRKKYRLTQLELSKLSGIGVASINRYENGALQSESHDNMLRLLKSPQNVNRLLAEKKSQYTVTEIDSLRSRIDHSGLGKEDLLEHVLRNFANYPEDEFSGYRRFNIEKFFQIIKFFCFREGIWKSKLMKLLFYADFKHFKEYGVSITGSRYAHLPYGPVPDQFETWITIMLDWKKALKQNEYSIDKFSGTKYQSDEPDWAGFTSSEHAVLALVANTFDQMSAKETGEFSHQEDAYKETDDGELISYLYAKNLQI